MTPDQFADNLRGIFDVADRSGFEVVLLFEGLSSNGYAKGELGGQRPYWDAMQNVAKEHRAVMTNPDRIFDKQGRPRKDFYLDACHMTCTVNKWPRIWSTTGSLIGRCKEKHQRLCTNKRRGASSLLPHPANHIVSADLFEGDEA